jgi:hypothetical protein
MYDWPMTHYIFNLYSPNHMKKCKIAIQEVQKFLHSLNLQVQYKHKNIF